MLIALRFPSFLIQPIKPPNVFGQVLKKASIELQVLKMVNKTVIVALLLLILAAACTFVGVYFGVGKQKHGQEFFKAAVAADAGPCSVVGR